ncbi:MAG: HipA family kinase [Mesorhizobium sp.]
MPGHDSSSVLIVDNAVLRTLTATRYVTPLREGGSMPAIVEADDDGLYVLKFRGAGQGRKALIAELVAGEIARALGLPMPEIVFIELDPDMARTEPDQEIQQLIRDSGGLNLGLDYLPGSVNFDPLVEHPAAELASRIVWFDAFIQNVDRTARNTNMLLWHRNLWLIDHGAAFYFHHDWTRAEMAATARFAPVKDHVLLPLATRLEEADAALAPKLTPELVADVTSLIPDGWLEDDPAFPDAEAHRAAYADHLTRRIAAPRAFVDEAIAAHKRIGGDL